MGLKLRDNKLITGLDTLCSMTRASPIQNLLEFSVLGQVSLGLTFFFFFFSFESEFMLNVMNVKIKILIYKLMIWETY